MAHRVPNVTPDHVVVLLYLLTGEELPLVLVDNSVTGGHSAILIPSHGCLEVPGVGKSISSCNITK